MYSPPLTSFLITSTEDDLRRLALPALPIIDVPGDEELSGVLFDDEALRTMMPAPPPVATTALSRIEERVLENLE